MKSRKGWRQMRTAPKDRDILLVYPSFSDTGPRFFVNQGRWINVLHNAQLMRALTEKTPVPPPDPGHWEVAYCAILEHGGAWIGTTTEPRMWTVRPIAWRELPSYE
jgi:hypothetical protein